MLDQVGGQALDVPPGRAGLGHGHERPSRVTLGERLDQLVEHGHPVIDGAGGRDLVEHREGVASRTVTPPDGEVDRLCG